MDFIDKIINGYTIKHLIGSDGMADVYYTENKLGKKAAIKVLKSELCAISSIKERFEQEARIMVILEHKHIRQAYDLDEVNGQPAIIMEYLEGHTLKQLIDKGKISDDKAKKYFDQCVSALRVAHAKEIVHRDIKPSNIFVTGDDEVKILDFGIAKLAESGLGTRTNQILGTPVYMSPEQIKSPKNVGTKSDVYSLAVTFYHALTGKVPYDSTTGSDFEIQSKIVHEDLDLNSVSSLWGAILRPMLLKDPDRRIDINGIDGLNGGSNSIDATQYDFKTKPKFHEQIKKNESRKSEGDNTSKEELKPVEPKVIKDNKNGNIAGNSIGNLLIYLIIGLVLIMVMLLKDENKSVVSRVDEITDVSQTTDAINSSNIDHEEELWQEAKNKNIESAYSRYMFLYPNGKYINEAKIKMAEVSSPKIDDIKQDNETKKVMQTKEKSQVQKDDLKPFIKMISVPGRNFKLSETEVTIGQYLAFCKATNSHWPEWLEEGNECNIYTGSLDFYKRNGMSESNTKHPITGVSALDAEAFCGWMGGRLPTEAEWEYAAMGGESYEYAGSDNLNEVGWHTGNSQSKAQKVKQKLANGYGLYDMSGNVWEWTSSKVEKSRVHRGGSWAQYYRFCQVSYRYTEDPDTQSSIIGFRLAMDN